MDIRKIARRKLIEVSANEEDRDLARGVLELLVAMQTIASVPTDSHEPLQATCATIASSALTKWTGENWVGGAGGFNAPPHFFPNRSPSSADKGG